MVDQNTVTLQLCLQDISTMDAFYLKRVCLKGFRLLKKDECVVTKGAFFWISKKDIMDSVDPCYHDALRKLPAFLWPQSTEHGKHSYTVPLGFPIQSLSMKVQPAMWGSQI